MPADIAETLARAAEIATMSAAGASTIDRDGAFPEREFASLATSGLLAAPVRRELGGFGFGSEPGRTAALLRLLSTLGWGNLSVARLYEGHVNALLLIQLFGAAAQRERFARDATERGRVFAVWNTEAADGVRLVPLGDGRFRLEGAKTFASGAGHVSRPLVTGALPDGGWQMAVLSMERVRAAIDESSWRPLGMRASASHTIDLTGIEVGADDLIGVPGDYYRQPWFSGGAIRFAAAQLGGAAALLDTAREELRALGRTEDAFQRARTGQVAIAVESGRLWLQSAAEVADRSMFGGSDPGSVTTDDMVAYAHMVRTAIECVCLEVLDLVERSVGARALLQPNPIERIGRDLRVYLRQPAPDAALVDAGRHVLASSRPALHLWPSGAPAEELTDAR